MLNILVILLQETVTDPEQEFVKKSHLCAKSISNMDKINPVAQGDKPDPVGKVLSIAEVSHMR